MEGHCVGWLFYVLTNTVVSHSIKLIESQLYNPIQKKHPCVVMHLIRGHSILLMFLYCKDVTFLVVLHSSLWIKVFLKLFWNTRDTRDWQGNCMVKDPSTGDTLICIPWVPLYYHDIIWEAAWLSFAYHKIYVLNVFHNFKNCEYIQKHPHKPVSKSFLQVPLF